jgi:hypothetical protein
MMIMNDNLKGVLTMENNENLLEIFCASENIDEPKPVDIPNFGGNTDESLFINQYSGVD